MKYRSVCVCVCVNIKRDDARRTLTWTSRRTLVKESRTPVNACYVPRTPLTAFETAVTECDVVALASSNNWHIADDARLVCTSTDDSRTHSGM